MTWLLAHRSAAGHTQVCQLLEDISSTADFILLFFHIRTKVRMLGVERVLVFKKIRAIDWVDENIVTEVKKKKEKKNPSGYGSCWDISMQNFYFKVSMSRLPFLMSSAHFSLMPCKMNIVNTRRQEQELMAREDLIM